MAALRWFPPCLSRRRSAKGFGIKVQTQPAGKGSSLQPRKENPLLKPLTSYEYASPAFQHRRNGIAGMLADDEEGRGRLAVANADRIGIVGAKQRREDDLG